MIRTILSPGVELNEVDKSQYTPNVGTAPRALVMGFASQGPNKTTTEITSMREFRNFYGTPTNEVERYFYNAAEYLVGKGTTVVAAKIPYVDDNKYVGIQYKVESTTADNPTDKALIYFRDGTVGEIEIPADGTITTSLLLTLLTDRSKTLADIKEVIIGSDCKVLDSELFKDCTNLSRVSFMSDTTNLKNSVFKNCTSLTSIRLPAKCTQVGEASGTGAGSSFEGCINLTSVIVGSTLTTLAANTFKGCTELKNIDLQNVKTIKSGAFANCSSLKTVILRAEYKSSDTSAIAADAFESCVNIEKVTFDTVGQTIVKAIKGDPEYWGLNNCWIQCNDKKNNGADKGTIKLGTPTTSRSVKSVPFNDDLTILEDTFSRDASSDSYGIARVKSLLSAMDPSITDLTLVSSSTSYPLNFDTSTFLALQSGDRKDVTGGDTSIDDVLGRNTFIIVDKTRGKYKTFTGNGSNVDCLGILPVVTTAVNAMAIAESIDGVKMNSGNETEISTINDFEPLDGIKYIEDMNTLSDSEISGFWSIGPKTIKDSNTLNSISKIASQFFPPVNYSSQVSATVSDDGTMPFDHNMFSYIGIVVFKITVDRGSGCLVAEPVEAFAGSLLEDAKDLRTNASTFIENVVNTTSNYISIYVDENLALNTDNLMTKNSILYANPSDGVILGIPPSTITKTISYETIEKNMDDVFKAHSNILASTLDVVVDAGLSTIGQCVDGTKDEFATPVDELPLIKGCTQELSNGPWKGWRKIVNRMKKFCESTRKDCVFIVDAPRFLSLKNQRKIVSAYDSESSVTDNILPKIKLISGINTSYGWGYTTWFKIDDSSDGTTFWCPPSIFGAGAYIDTRTNWHTWDAPAGMTRGVVYVDDTSFEPDLNARNVIYSNGWNYALTDIQNGVTTLEGQKTFQSYTSAFDRINVRSLFLDLERRVFRIARNYIYEPNTADTRQQFVDNITPIFENTMAAGGCYDYKIVADESINTPEVIDNNEFRIRIGVQPTKTIEFILMEFVAARTGSNWSELVME